MRTSNLIKIDLGEKGCEVGWIQLAYGAVLTKL
jgi:hypothetical protein